MILLLISEMFFMRIVSLVFVIASCLPVFSQTEYVTISGYIQNSETGEKLIGATVYDTHSEKGAVSNNYGFYSLSIPQNIKTEIVISFVGYNSFKVQLNVQKSQRKDFSIIPGNELAEVVITGGKEKPIEQRREMSVVKIPIKDIEMLPSLGGETDIIKALQLMPGVQSGNEASSNLHVRGGSPDQNLILLDDVPLYYVNHLGGFVSTFNTDAINDVKLIKGGFPAYYGSRLSSIVDVRMKDGNRNEFHGSGMLGVVASKISVEGPIKKDATSYIVSFRRLLLDLLMRPVTKIAFDGYSTGYHFYDFNAKINHKLSDKDHLHFSAYSGDDVLLLKFKDDRYNNKGRFKWGNNLLSFRWNHLYGQKLFSNLTLSYTRYRYLTDNEYKENFSGEENSFYRSFSSGIYDAAVKMDFEYFASPNYKLKFGLGSIYHTFAPSITAFQQEGAGIEAIDTIQGVNIRIRGLEHAAYVENEISIGSRFNSNIGLRFNSYHVNQKDYLSLEPRVMLGYLLTKNLSFKASYSEMQQNIHLLSSTGTGMPIDLWLPATDKARPERSQQWALGIAQSVKEGIFELSVEAYYKKIRNMIAYKPGAGYVGATAEWEDKIEVNGLGKASGLEFLLQKKEGRTTGWIGYTLAKTDRQFININNGNWYPYKYDRRHDISIVVVHRLKENIDMSATWVYGTGNAYTLSLGQYEMIDYIKGSYPRAPYGLESQYVRVELYSDKNAYRMRDFHKLDIGINFRKKKKWGERTWNLSVYNLYNRQNPYYYYFEKDVQYDNEGFPIESSEKLTLKQQSLFPIIPSASYSFKF